ncbi:LysE family transporter [Ferrovibrio sp.]|uniref:LysE family transporter n=1 Tax=Ferrovibrio sp. TaxID=1917215 RepID=UPI003D2B5EFF
MDLLPHLVALAGMHLLMAMVPGPNTVVVSHFSAARSRRDGLAAMAGVVLASLLWVGLSLAGIGLLLEAGALYRLLRLLGAAYLLYVAFRLLRSALRRQDAATAPPALGWLGQRPFAAGLVTTLSNPKSAVFWTSVFAIALPAAPPTWFYAAVIAVIAVQSALWYGLVALLLSTGIARQGYARIARWLDGLAGLAMLGLGLKLGDEVRREFALRLP